jgi:hypothetical protein
MSDLGNALDQLWPVESSFELPCAYLFLAPIIPPVMIQNDSYG